ncbi:MAG: hypothetical protein JO033_09370 [Acidobacteriaceae bacterium]|nr:hypothetical protein [Acidobacteriaceae bacterium]
MGERKLQTALLGIFGLSALLLAALGLYGVLGFYVSQGTREIGLRVVLGARPDQIFAHVFKQGALMTIGGITVGISAGRVLRLHAVFIGCGERLPADIHSHLPLTQALVFSYFAFAAG